MPLLQAGHEARVVRVWRALNPCKREECQAREGPAQPLVTNDISDSVCEQQEEKIEGANTWSNPTQNISNV